MRKFLVSAVLCGVGGAMSLHAGSSFATNVFAYDAGADANPAYVDPNTALGSPERYTGEGVFPSPVSPVNPAFGTDELVSIGSGGSLTVEFATPIVDDPANPFGVDLLLFGNSFFVFDGAVGSLFANGSFTVSLSSDGQAFTALPNTFADGLFPTLGYQDLVDPFDSAPGTVLTDFTQPLDPTLTTADFAGLTYAQLSALYGSSGGGMPIDIAAAGVADARFVRIDVIDGPLVVDAFSIVPEPASGLLVFVGAGLLVQARRLGRRRDS